MGAKTHPTPSQQELQHFFEYNPDTGHLTRKADGYIGNINVNGYRITRWDRIDYYVHRLIWKYVTGEEAIYIDHIDGNKANNVWTNLRSVTRHVNNRNTKLYKNSKSGYPGVNPHNRDSKYQSIMTINRKQVFLGYFNCPTAAYIRRLRYIKEHPELQYSDTHGTR